MTIYRTPVGERVIREWCAERLAGWAVPHERSSVSTRAGATSVLTAGSGSPAVVVVPGTNMASAVSLSLAGALADRRRVVLVDLPGQPGLSTGTRPAAYGPWLAEVLEQVTISDQVIVLGHSLGGAAVLACESPWIAARLAVSTAGLAPLAVSPGVLRATLPWLVRPTPARSTRLLRLMGAPGHQPAGDLIEWMTLVARHVRSSLAPPPLPPDVLARRRGTRCLVATGEHDVFLPPRRLGPVVDRRLGLSLRVVPAAGHLVTEEQPGVLADMVDELAAGTTR